MSHVLGRGDNRAVTELGFAHVTTKTWAYSEVFDFLRKKIWRKNCPPHPNHFLELPKSKQRVLHIEKITKGGVITDSIPPWYEHAQR